MRKQKSFNDQRSAISGQRSTQHAACSPSPSAFPCLERSRRIPRPSANRGIALILTLAIIALVTLLVIGFAVSMRVENTASKNFNDVIKARELAQGAIDQAVATIRQATTRDGVTILNYVTFPGAVYDFNGTATTRKSLYTENALDTFDINKDFWITGNEGEFPGTPVPPANAVINVGWNYVAKDGSVGTAPFLPSKPEIIGRFAFWVDDEACKININTAGQPTTPPSPDYGYSVSNEVDISANIAAVLYSNLSNYAPDIERGYSGVTVIPRGTYPYATIEEVRRANAVITAGMFDANRFSITAYSDDANYPSYTQDLDALGQTRLVLTNLHHVSLADSDIEGTADGGISNAYVRLSQTALQNVYSSTLDPDGFKTKYGDAGLKQIIANIIAYQIDPAVTPPPDDSILPSGLPIPGAPAYLGLAKTPYISEVQVRYVFTGSSPNFHVARIVTVELFNMYDTDFTGQAGDQVRVDGLPNLDVGLPTTVYVNVGSVPTGKAVATASSEDDRDFSTGVLTLLGNQISATYTRNYAVEGTRRLDFAQMTLPLVTGTPISGTQFQDCELIGDPALNELNINTEWQTHTDGDGPRLNSYTYPGGVDNSKAVIRGAGMRSVGELGYIHLPSTAPNAAWGHLRLQGGNAVNHIPDWAMLDIFTVGNTVIPNVTRGRININSFINPGLATAAPATARLVPLKALLNSLSGIITPGATALQIYNIAGGYRTDTFGMKDPGTGYPIFDTIGEICEIPNLNIGGNQASIEAVIRRIGNLITVRSNTFTIWVIAQSIADADKNGSYNPAPAGQDAITGEVRAQVVVERYEDLTLAPTDPNRVKFRVRYFRYL